MEFIRQLFSATTVILLASPGLPASGQGAEIEAGQPAEVEWVRVHPGGSTGCAFDTPFSFFHHMDSDVTKLLLYFQGGGACWEWVSCSGMFDSSVDSGELSEYRGIFDRSNPANPFRDFGVVFIPYCTGDVHVGDATVQHGGEASVRPIHHRGYRNTTAALEWLASQPLSLEHIVISGASAGSYGALFYMPAIATRFPSVPVTLIGDSGVPLLNDYSRMLETWGARAVLRRLWGEQALDTDDEITLERAFEVASATRPDAILAEITSDRDAVQSAFYLISGSSRWREDTYDLLDSLHARMPTVRSFIVEGSDHGLLRTDAFYTYHAGGVTLIHWIQQLLDGAPVDSHRCAECGR